MDEITSGGVPRDGIPPIDHPQFVAPSEADRWLADVEPVALFEMNGDARAYPLQILIWHEIVNDVVGGEPVAITFCPLCNTAIAFKRVLDGVVYDFGTTGKLRHSNLVMWDRQTQSWWQQITGEAIVGDLTGQKLTFLPASIVSWADFKTAFPQGQVLSRDTGYSRRYGFNPYIGYDDVGRSPFLFDGVPDGRLPAMERVVAVTISDEDKAYPFSLLAKERAVEDTVGGQDIVVFWAPGTVSALGGRVIADSRDVGAAAVFDPHLEGRRLGFMFDNVAIRDLETGSTWNILGQAVDGPLAGKQLTPVIHANHFWFAWAAFKPGTAVYQGRGAGT